MSGKRTGRAPHAGAQNRRAFFRTIGGVTAAMTAAGAGWPATAEGQGDPLGMGPTCSGLPATARADQAFELRLEAARFEQKYPLPPVVCATDEQAFPDRIAVYSKGLPHNALGEASSTAYAALLRALRSGDPADFEAIPLGGPTKLTNPQAGLAFEMLGPDAQRLTMPAPPSFSSAEEAGEIVENYWMALLRDVPFNDYPTNPLVQQACADLSRLSDFRGPKVNGQVTPQTLFRENLPGALVGPYLSQFLWLNCPYGVQLVEQRMQTTAPNLDYLTAYGDWLAVQNGATAGANQFDPVRRYPRNGRDIGQWVHIDVLFQAYFNALLILFALGAPRNAGNPYNVSRTQYGFGTLGDPYYASVLCAVATRALKAVWWQKWGLWRRLRPEEFAGRIHNRLTGAANYPIHRDALNAAATAQVFSKYGTYLLPMAFPEGCPTHPAYGAGHATVAGACVTVLKALFDESFVIPNPVLVSSDGLQHQPYSGPPLTVGGELNKLAINIALGRDFAGVHWRTDGLRSLQLGEEAAIRFLREEKLTFNEQVNGFPITRFDGSPLLI